MTAEAGTFAICNNSCIKAGFIAQEGSGGPALSTAFVQSRLLNCCEHTIKIVSFVTKLTS